MKKYLIAILFFCLSILLSLSFSPTVLAQNEIEQGEVELNQQLPTSEHKEETIEGRVTQILAVPVTTFIAAFAAEKKV